MKHELTIPKCPQQNGVSERFNRTVMEMVRSMLSNAKLHQRFWAEALSTAVSIRKRCPTKAVQGKTPYEVMLHLRVFGCAGHCHIAKDERQKLDEKSQKFIFLGYSDNLDYMTHM